MKNRVEISLEKVLKNGIMLLVILCAVVMWNPIAAEAKEILRSTKYSIDVNGDGKVDSLDAMLIYACHNGKKALSEKQRLVADVNGDGKVDSFDAMLVYAYHNGKIKKFPIENK